VSRWVSHQHFELAEEMSLWQAACGQGYFNTFVGLQRGEKVAEEMWEAWKNSMQMRSRKIW